MGWREREDGLGQDLLWTVETSMLDLCPTTRVKGCEVLSSPYISPKAYAGSKSRDTSSPAPESTPLEKSRLASPKPPPLPELSTAAPRARIESGSKPDRSSTLGMFKILLGPTGAELIKEKGALLGCCCFCCCLNLNRGNQKYCKCVSMDNVVSIPIRNVVIIVKIGPVGQEIGSHGPRPSFLPCHSRRAGAAEITVPIHTPTAHSTVRSSGHVTHRLALCPVSPLGLSTVLIRCVRTSALHVLSHH